MSISTHILDISLGQPAAGVMVSLARLDSEAATWTLLHESRTDIDGRIKALLPADAATGEKSTIFRLRFATATYFAEHGQATLYPYVDIVFEVDADAHYHIPLLLTANSYTTYRGS